MSLSIIQGALEQGLIYAIMAVGIFISFRVLNIPDLTVDGTFTLGTSVSAIFAFNGYPLLGIVVSIFAGAMAGCVTGFLQTKMKFQPILAGILTMTALYSINLRIMQKPNLSLFDKESIFSYVEKFLGDATNLVVIAFILVIFTDALVFAVTTVYSVPVPTDSPPTNHSHVYASVTAAPSSCAVRTEPSARLVYEIDGLPSNPLSTLSGITYSALEAHVFWLKLRALTITLSG